LNKKDNLKKVTGIANCLLVKGAEQKLYYHVAAFFKAHSFQNDAGDLDGTVTQLLLPSVDSQTYATDAYLRPQYFFSNCYLISAINKVQLLLYSQFKN